MIIVCHMTHLNNLPNIVRDGGLFCKNELIRKNVNFEDIANYDVQDKRANIFVPLTPYGTLHDYVPFYFWGTTPMLLVNEARQGEIIFLVSKVSDILASGISFMFTDRHAVIRYANFYANLNDLNKLDWDTIKLRYWSNPEDPAVKEKKQAEFLVYKRVPWELIYGVGVIDEEARSNVTDLLSDQKHKPLIKAKPE